MNKIQKLQLYNMIMESVAKTVKKQLNEVSLETAMSAQKKVQKIVDNRQTNRYEKRVRQRQLNTFKKYVQTHDSDDFTENVMNVIPTLKRIYNGKLYLSKNNKVAADQLMMWTVGLVQDNTSPLKFESPLYNQYKGDFNPYDYSWFDAGYDDFFDECGDATDWVTQWISENYNEWVKLYKFCKENKDILTCDVIWELWTVIDDDDFTIIDYFKCKLSGDEWDYR